jgi:hypothetical protein
MPRGAAQLATCCSDIRTCADDVDRSHAARIVELRFEFWQLNDTRGASQQRTLGRGCIAQPASRHRASLA